MKLYRCESGTITGRRPAPQPESWIWQGMVACGAWDAVGRWFVADPSMLVWYARETGDSFRIVSVEVPAELAEEWRVSRNPSAMRFSRDVENEFFLPRDIAESAVHDVGMTEEIAGVILRDTSPSACP